MPFAVRLSLVLAVVLLFTGPVESACGGNRPIALCCMGIGPFSSNAGVWGGICGYNPPSQNEIEGARCIPNPGSCPPGSISTCCAGMFPGQCALGTNCGTPVFPPPILPPIIPAPIPDGWVTDYACSSDTGRRVLANAVVNELPDTNTPSACISLCASQGYTYAGVEYAKECICGTAYKDSPAPAVIDASNCIMRCAGNNQYTCGGSFAIQLYHGPPPPDPLPPGWSQVFACAVDVPSRALTGDVLTQLAVNSPGLCSAYCAQQGYAYAGVEYGKECHCGSGVAPGTAAAQVADCSQPCAGNLGLTCGGSFRIQIYSSST